MWRHKKPIRVDSDGMRVASSPVAHLFQKEVLVERLLSGPQFYLPVGLPVLEQLISQHAVN